MYLERQMYGWVAGALYTCIFGGDKLLDSNDQPIDVIPGTVLTAEEGFAAAAEYAEGLKYIHPGVLCLKEIRRRRANLERDYLTLAAHLKMQRETPAPKPWIF